MDLNYYDDLPDGQRTKVESTDIYLAKPGQRLLGALNGVDKNSANLEINLNNTDVLEFTLNRIVDGEISSWYDFVERHYELYVPKYGWFKINEEPEVTNDGNIETKTVRAESLEIELQQYDLVNFNINIGNEASREYLATDNTYQFNDYTFFYDNVLFYRDTTAIQNAIDEFSEMEDTLENLVTYIQQMIAQENYSLIACPRVLINTQNLSSAVDSAVNDYIADDQQDVADALKKRYDKIVSADANEEYKQQQYKSMIAAYSKLYDYIGFTINNSGDDDVTYKASEILQRELQRQNELSLLWLILHDHDWEVGYVDPWKSEETASPDEWDKIIIDDDKIRLADKVGMFQIDSKDIYAFMTQDMAAYFRCIFVFDTVNRKVNCFNINNVGYDTNIYLSFRNIMNSVTRSSDQDIYTVFHVRGGEDLDFIDANYGEDWIEDISYFLNTKHFSREFIDKYKEWAWVRDYKRPQYMRLSKEYKNQLDVVSEILDRVPVDAADPQQYSTFSNDDLVQEKKNQEAMIEGYKSFFPLAEDQTPEQVEVPQTLKILGIGNSHTRDGVRWLCKVLVDAGVENVVVGNGYIGGLTLKEQYDAIFNESDNNHATYEYMKCDSSTNPIIRTITTKTWTLNQVIDDENWDIVVFQQKGDRCGWYPEWVSKAFDINNFATYVKERIGNPNLKIGITAHWSHSQNYDSDKYEEYYGSNPKVQLKANIEVAEKVKRHMGELCDFIIPTGLAVNYARRNAGLRSIKNSLLRNDGNHLEYGIPMYLVSMAYAMTILPQINLNALTWYPTADDDENISVGATEINAIAARKAAIQACGGDPYYDTATNWEELKKSIYWKNYKMIRDIVIPNIEIEMLNRTLSEEDVEEDFDEDYKLDFDLYGDSYGINELKYQLNAINNKIAVYKENGYNKKSTNNDAYHDSQYELYKKYARAKKSCQAALEDRQAEYDIAEKELDAIRQMMRDVEASVSKDNEEFGFTEDELKLLDRYYIHTDYTNDNIVTTSITTNEERVDMAYKLLLYAKDQLSAESHPQWNWSTTQDNLLLMPEFKDWYGEKKNTTNEWNYTQLWIGNFVRVGFREDDSNKSITALLNEDEIQNLLIDRYTVPPTDGSEGTPHNGLVGTFVNRKNEGYQAKLRVSKISLNPFMIDPTIDIEFTSMVQYKYRRNDFISILESGNSSSKNTISAGIVSNVDKYNTFTVDSNMILQLMKSGAFTSYVTDIASSAASGGGTYAAVQQSISNGAMHSLVASITSETLNSSPINVSQLVGTDEAFNNLIANHIGAASINVNQITGDLANFGAIISDYIDTEVIRAAIADIGHIDADSAFIGYLNSGVIEAGSVTADKVVAALVEAEEGDFERLTAESAFINKILTVGEAGITQITEDTISTATINADQINTQGLTAESALVRDILTIGTDTITTIAEGTITTENVVASLVQAQTGDFDDLTANSAFVQYLNSGIIEAGTVSADTIIAGLASVTDEQISKFNLLAGSAYLDYLESNLIVASEIKVNELKAKLADISVADIDQLSTNHAFINSLQALSSTAATSVINDAYIYNAVAGKIAVADLLAGDITVSDQMRILSANGKMVMNGSALQIMGTDGQGNDYVGVQLGYATNGQPSLILRNEDGATILSPTGITSDAVADGLIVNNMISDSTIQKSKLGFPIVETNQDGTINITNIKTGEGGNFGVEYTTFTQNTSDAIDDLSGGIDEINSKKMYRVVIESDNGNIFKNGDVNCTLSCHVYSWDNEITNDINAAYFTWIRKSKDSAGDAQWNANHSGGTKSITLTPADVWGRSVFFCTVTLPDGSTVSGS